MNGGADGGAVQLRPARPADVPAITQLLAGFARMGMVRDRTAELLDSFRLSDPIAIEPALFYELDHFIERERGATVTSGTHALELQRDLHTLKGGARLAGQKRLGDLSAEPMGLTPAQTADYMKQETRRWAAVIRTAGVKMD